MIYFCCDDRRRNAVSEHPTLNGIDFLEVSADQQQLSVHFVLAAEGVVKTVAPPGLTPANVRITGGERITRIRVVSVDYDGEVLVVRVDDDDNPANGVGDFSTYTLHLVDVPNLDPLLAAVDFSFKVECSSDFDCRVERVCPPELRLEPNIDYLAKDYASFRQLMLDRMSLLMPQWKERNPADIGIVLVELLAYVGDYLSYQQDAVATEAYLGAARRRVSVRRHARLVDYFMHDGSNARVWVQVQVNADGIVLPGPSEEQHGTQLLTHVAGQPARIPPNSQAYTQAMANRPEVFETIHDITLFQAHNEMHFYTWGARECCLPKGATRAALRGSYPNLKKGDVLIFEEVYGPLTGEREDADLTHRHAIRLTEIALTKDLLGGRFDEPPNNNPVEVTELTWATEDALPFALCISARTDADHGSRYLANVSVVRGNIALADHGRTIKDEELGEVPPATILRPAKPGADRCAERTSEPVPPRFRPRLKEVPLTQAAPTMIPTMKRNHLNR